MHIYVYIYTDTYIYVYIYMYIYIYILLAQQPYYNRVHFLGLVTVEGNLEQKMGKGYQGYQDYTGYLFPSFPTQSQKVVPCRVRHLRFLTFKASRLV